MTRVELRELCGELPIGKRLPDTCYFAREAIDHLPAQLKELIDHLSNQTGVQGAPERARSIEEAKASGSKYWPRS
jgi:hypothetical protein